jgi:uncharacterized protein YlxW (UPF0749 family)
VKKVDKHKKNISFIAISTVIGFMIAIQFQTVKEPVERDTRDLWQLREALLQEKELQSELVSEIRSNEEKLLAYESKQKQSKEQGSSSRSNIENSTYFGGNPIRNTSIKGCFT